MHWDRATTGTARVEGATEPYWLVLGQSHSSGWHATLDGEDLGPPVLLDGYANGWLVDPAQHGASHRVRLTWTPQRVVDLALVLSLVGVLVAAIVALRGRADHGPATIEAPELVLVPVPAPPLRTRSAITLTLVAAGVALLAAPFPSPLVVVLAAVAAASCRWRTFASAPALLAAAAMAIAGVATTLVQYRERFFPDFQWPKEFEPLHVVGVACLLLLGLQGARDALAARAEPGAGPSPARAPTIARPDAEQT
jgi:hypothetical protein